MLAGKPVSLGLSLAPFHVPSLARVLGPGSRDARALALDATMTDLNVWEFSIMNSSYKS